MKEQNILWIVFTIILLISIIYFYIRSIKSLDFVLHLINCISKHNIDCIDKCNYEEMVDYDIYPSYPSVLFSFKLIKYKNFIDEKYINILNLDDEKYR